MGRALDALEWESMRLGCCLAKGRAGADGIKTASGGGGSRGGDGGPIGLLLLVHAPGIRTDGAAKHTHDTHLPLPLLPPSLPGV